MAKDNAATLGEAPVAKRTRTELGPRKVKPIHAAVRVTDASGNAVPGAKVEVVKTSKEFEDIYTVVEGDSTLSRMRIPLDSKTA